MTADNIVLRWIARWLMRIEAARGVIMLALFGGTFINTGLSMLHDYGMTQYARPFIVVTGLGTLGFAYLYVRTGTWNQKNRDKKDMGTNYVGPNLYMRYQMQAAQLAVLYHALENGMSPEQFHDELVDITEEQWASFREGVDEELLKQ